MQEHFGHPDQLCAAFEKLRAYLESDPLQADDDDGEVPNLCRPLLYSVLQSVPASIVALDLEGRVMFWNAEAERMFGWRADEVIGKFHPIIAPEEREDFRASLSRRMTGAEIRDVPRRPVHKDGRRIDLRLTSGPLRDSNGRVFGILGIGVEPRRDPPSDLAGQPHDERFRRMLMDSQDGIWILDQEGRTTYVDERMARMLGGEPKDVTGRSLFDFIDEADRPTVENNLCRRKQGIVEEHEFRFLRLDGGHIWTNLVTTPLYDHHQQYCGALGVVSDITSHKQIESILEQRVQERTAELIEANRKLAAESEARQQALEALATSESMFRLYADNATDMISRHAPDGTYLYVSPASRKLLGWEPDELVGRSPYDFFHPDDRSRIAASHHQVLQTYEPTTVEYRIRRKNGSYFWFETISKSVVDQKTGEVLELHCTSRDVTSRKNAELALQRTNERLEYLLSMTTAVIYSCKPTRGYKVTFMSDSVESLVGYRAEQFLADPQFWGAHIHPDDRVAVMDTLQKALKESNFHSCCYRFRHANGQYRWMYDEVRVGRDEHGNPKELIGYWTDITEHRVAEEQLRLIQSAVDQVEEAVVITEADLEFPGPRIVYVNPAFTTMTGYTSDEVLGKSPRILQGPRTDRQLLEDMKRSLLEHGRFNGETYNYRKDGSEFVLNWHIMPIRDENGHITHWVSIQRDVTAQKQQEALARLRQAELAHVGRLSTMGEMASGLAHELNQPLAAISIYVQGCERRMQNAGIHHPKVIDALERIRNQADRAGQIIRRMRNFVRKREPQRTASDINQLIRDVIELTEPDLRHHSVMMQLALADGLPPCMVDSVQIEQVILNLVRNAIEAMENQAFDKRHVIVRSMEREGGSGVRVSVQDVGPGIDDETLAKIFEPFFTTKDQGMGMGLNISQTIIEAHNGRLWAERSEDAGMIFNVDLPVSNPDEAELTG